jgi:hypothetical protein
MIVKVIAKETTVRVYHAVNERKVLHSHIYGIDLIGNSTDPYNTYQYKIDETGEVQKANWYRDVNIISMCRDEKVLTLAGKFDKFLLKVMK